MNMCGATVFVMGDSPALPFAARAMEQQGVKIAQEPGCDVTHVLLPVPAKEVGGIPENVTVIGGNLSWLDATYPRVDLLRDDLYVAENAALTADCALRLLGQYLEVPFRGCKILVIGWGRIGKLLGSMLKNLGADISVAARKPADRGMLTALGYPAIDPAEIDPVAYQAIVNTAPAPVMGETTPDCLNIDLASKPGLGGENVLWARALPGKMLPKAAGACIARGVMRHLQEGWL